MAHADGNPHVDGRIGKGTNDPRGWERDTRRTHGCVGGSLADVARRGGLKLATKLTRQQRGGELHKRQLFRLCCQGNLEAEVHGGQQARGVSLASQNGNDLESRPRRVLLSTATVSVLAA
jgi:hypothetical protein